MSTTLIAAGKHILDIITSGMYSNSLMVLREYIQNAVDAVDEAVTKGLIDYNSSRIDIEIDSENRGISITDNGVGVPSFHIASILSGIGISSKANKSSRGFRGIGRLGGVGYCDQVVFETRSAKNEEISIAVWNGKLLRDECRDVNNDMDLFTAIKKVVHLEKRLSAAKDPDHFFKITMNGVHRFHRDDLMNIEVIRSYLSQVAPVPFDKKSFNYQKEIEAYLKDIDGYRNYNIFLNGDKIYKPHCKTFAISNQNRDVITGVHLFELKGRNEECIGRGWFAECTYKASLLQSERMRGIRLRQGNIGIGDEYFLADYYTERRFCTWHIGEIHFNYNLRLNARRDGFEQSPEYECFIEQANLLCKHLSNLCRIASKVRSQEMIHKKAIVEIEDTLERALFSKNKHRIKAIEKAKNLLEATTNKVNGKNYLYQHKKLGVLQEKLNKLQDNTVSLSTLLDGRILRGISQKNLIEEIAKGIIENYTKYGCSVSLVKSLISPYLRKDVDIRSL